MRIMCQAITQGRDLATTTSRMALEELQTYKSSETHLDGPWSSLWKLLKDRGSSRLLLTSSNGAEAHKMT